MPALIILVTVGLYAGALFLWVRAQSYRYTVALVAGHLLVAMDPLWQWLYRYSYVDQGPSQIFGRGVPLFAVLGVSWAYALPALAFFYAQGQSWWPRSYWSGVGAFLGMLVYHVLLQGVAKQTALWRFDLPIMLSWGLPSWLVVALLGALVSLVTASVLSATRHYAGFVFIPTLAAGIVVAPILVYGILGAPFWLPLLLDESPALLSLGALVTLALSIWVVHLACAGLQAPAERRVLGIR
ncbi:MAG TPA: hypothetical protein VGE07_16815 [Herpetosiphonaceae bacterium]